MKQIELTRGMSTMVDDEDFEWLNQYNWFAHKRRTKMYAARTVWLEEGGEKKSKTISMHREIMHVSNLNVIIDHKDLDSLNNQKSNLRICTISQNNANIQSRQGSSSKFLGVYYSKPDRRWKAGVRKNRVAYNLGYFDSEIDAAKAYNVKAVELHGEFANLNAIQ